MTSAHRVWTALHGVICVYKPADTSITALKKFITKRLVTEVNEVCPPIRPRMIKVPVVEEHATGALVVVGEKEQPDYSEHPLVVGGSVRPEDVRVEEMSYMEATSSGLCLLGINDGCDKFEDISEKNLVNEYRLEGILGRQTRENLIKGRVTLKADYDHVTEHRMRKLLTRVQSEFRRVAFDSAEVDIESEEAFEMARRGTPRPRVQGAVVIHRLVLELFRPPYFALSVSCAGENEEMMRNLCQQLGISLGTTASPVRLQRRGIGPLRPKHALLEKQISLQNILRNISLCRSVLSSSATDSVVGEADSSVTSTAEASIRKVVDAVGLRSGGMEPYDAMRPAWPRSYD